MKRRRIIGLFIAFCAACAINCPVLAQTDTSPASSTPNGVQTEAAKEVQAYEAKYQSLSKEKGVVAALRFLLTPDYKQIDAFGKILTRDEYLGIFTGASQKERDAWLKHSKYQPNKPSTGKAWIYKPVKSENNDEYAPSADTITVTRHSTVVFTMTETTAEAATSKLGTTTAANPPKTHERRQTAIRRIIYRRTPDGLRLQEEKTISMRQFLDGKFESQEPVPRVGF